jgi:membrane protein
VRTIKAFAIGLYRGITDDQVTGAAAMMAYYAAFAIFPMLIFVVTLTLLVLPVSVLHDGVAMATQTLPPELAAMLRDQVDRMVSTASSGVAIGGALLALWGASRGAASLSEALNRMFGRHETRPWWKRQMIAIALTLVVALLIVVALALLFAGSLLGRWVSSHYGEGGIFDRVWPIARWVGAGLIILFVWSLIYRYLPDTDAPLHVFTPGAVIGVAMWLVVSWLFNLYVSRHDTYEITYGTLGGAILFLTWLWISNLALLVGAEINDVIAELRGRPLSAR